MSTVTRRSDRSSSQPRSRLATGAQSRTRGSTALGRRSSGRRCGRTLRRPCGPPRRRPAARPSARPGAGPGRSPRRRGPARSTGRPATSATSAGCRSRCQARCGVTEPAPATNRRPQLPARQRLVGDGFSDGLAERRPVGRREPVGLLPARKLPLAAGRAEGQVDAAILRRDEMRGAAERVGLEDLAGLERAGTSPGREPVRRKPTASSGVVSGQAGTAPSRPTTSPTEPVPTGSSRCRRSRHARACSHVRRHAGLSAAERARAAARAPARGARPGAPPPASRRGLRPRR